MMKLMAKKKEERRRPRGLIIIILIVQEDQDSRNDATSDPGSQGIYTNVQGLNGIKWDAIGATGPHLPCACFSFFSQPPRGPSASTNSNIEVHT